MLSARHHIDVLASNNSCIGVKSSVSYPVAQPWSSNCHVTSHCHLIVRASGRRSNSKASATEVGTASGI